MTSSKADATDKSNRTTYGIEVLGLESPKSPGPYGHDEPCEGELVLEVSSERVRIPVIEVRNDAYDFYGDVPKLVTFDAVYANTEKVYAVSEIDDGVIIEIYQAGGTWEMSRIDDPIEANSPIVWKRVEL